MNLKIITAFHGTVLYSKAFDHPDIYVPVYGGRTVSYHLPEQSRTMLADNTGDNISWMNPFIGEFTCIYWASKHLDQIGNPDYIGLNHYRRLFPVERYMQQLQQSEPFILTTAHVGNATVMQAAAKWCIGASGNNQRPFQSKGKLDTDLWGKFQRK